MPYGAPAGGPYGAYQHIYQQQHQQQQQQLQMFWADQYREIEQTTDFKNHSLPLADVRMIAAEAPVVFARACEMFILDLTHRRTLQKNDIAAAITRTDVFDFSSISSLVRIHGTTSSLVPLGALRRPIGLLLRPAVARVQVRTGDAFSPLITFGGQQNMQSKKTVTLSFWLIDAVFMCLLWVNGYLPVLMFSAEWEL
ncbi:unnamed protein product [Spirodela intermedia]|uniref:Transcription factor CBF/NF-Y/archaeal histone domain-containing protein n=1 Tax=Spirodela intermedia TaxID=51605 RepID=A0ABN7E9V0_SPIIN|nr:unnamed protein product [Spirodela intermedia]